MSVLAIDVIHAAAFARERHVALADTQAVERAAIVDRAVVVVIARRADIESRSRRAPSVNSSFLIHIYIYEILK